MDRSSVIPEADREVAHGRYCVERKLGEGGMAVVYEARDRSEARSVALKRMRENLGAKSESYTALFRQEFLALAQLAHPRIVAVYDFGVDARGPYYTMELLDGGDLRRLAPVDYRTACRLARDVCSALSLVHSRRMVFRDLSPSNVRCTSDGLAKLIDFGGLTPMGPAQNLVGTLPCVAPEVLNQQPLDARTDLYALGATLYFTLVKRFAYPARDASELLHLWQQRPCAPSELVPGIPRALDKLVLDLLELDPAHRPESAAEVMERLSVIAELPRDENLRVRQAYLATPQLVDREVPLLAVREQAARVQQGQGVSLLVSGPSGVGRSRLLEASALEAKLRGMLVLRSDARAADEDYAAARALGRDLLQQAPELARAHAAPLLPLLTQLLPELREGDAPAAPAELDDGAELHRHIQHALREWLCAVAKHKPVLLAADDVDRLDAPSAVFIALLARDAPEHAIFVVSAENNGAARQLASQGALQMLTRVSTRLELGPLSMEGSERLLRSVFGEVPHLAQTTQLIHRITAGVPRDVMLLAQHMVSEGIARYQAGAWSLPQRLSTTDLPASMADALMQRVGRLSSQARALAYAMVAEPTFAFSEDDCSLLIDMPAPHSALVLAELLKLEFASLHEGEARATQGAISAPLAESLDAATPEQLHMRLAELCESRGEMLRSAQHLYRAGARERGLERLIDHAVESQTRTRANLKAFFDFLRALPAGWLATYQQALEDCDRFGRAPRDKCVLLTRLSSMLAHVHSDVDGYAYQQKLMDRLAYDCGLDFNAALPEQLEPGPRVKAILGQAQVRYETTPDSGRGFDPISAAKELVATVLTSLGVLAYTNDYDAWARLPSLTPLVALSPAMPLVTGLVQAVGQRIGGRSEEALAGYQQLLGRFDAPDRAGLEPSYHAHTRIRIFAAIALLEATMGRASCLEKAQSLAESPRYESVALQIRQLYALFQGDLREARRIEQQVELLRLESNATHPKEALFELNELYAQVLANDLTGIKRSIDALSTREKFHETFRAALAYARGAHERIRGDAAAALPELTRALALMVPGQHFLWAPTATAYLRSLLDLGRSEEASVLGKSYLAQGEQLGYAQQQIRLALALALHAQGQSDQAVALVDEAIAQLTGRAITGLSLAAAYETRARLASELGDEAGFRRFADLYARLAPSGNRKLREAGQGGGELGNPGDDSEETLARLRSTLESCHTHFERLHVGLEFLGRRAGALGGAVFKHTGQGLVRTSAFGDAGRDPALDVWAADFFQREVMEPVTEDIAQMTAHAELRNTGAYIPVLLGHDHEGSYELTGLAVFIGANPHALRQAPELAAELSRALA